VASEEDENSLTVVCPLAPIFPNLTFMVDPETDTSQNFAAASDLRDLSSPTNSKYFFISILNFDRALNIWARTDNSKCPNYPT
jgi:hypothetical protein